MDRGAWQVTVHGVTRVGHNLVNHHQSESQRESVETSLMVQWLKLQAPNAGCSGFDPWSGNWIPHVAIKDPTYHN